MFKIKNMLMVVLLSAFVVLFTPSGLIANEMPIAPPENENPIENPEEPEDPVNLQPPTKEDSVEPQKPIEKPKPSENLKPVEKPTDEPQKPSKTIEMPKGQVKKQSNKIVPDKQKKSTQKKVTAPKKRQSYHTTQTSPRIGIVTNPVFKKGNEDTTINYPLQTLDEKLELNNETNDIKQIDKEEINKEEANKEEINNDETKENQLEQMDGATILNPMEENERTVKPQTKISNDHVTSKLENGFWITVCIILVVVGAGSIWWIEKKR